MKLYTADEMAKTLNVHIKTVYRWGREEKLTVMRVGRSVRFALPQIGDAYADNETEEERPLQ